MNVAFTKDRFGNENSAIYLFGNPDSYLNLGSYKTLKPVSGSISLWIKIELENTKGRGIKSNPVLLTKNSASDDYYESYAIYYIYESDRIEAAASRDSLVQVGIYGMKEFSRFEWHHLVMSYDDNYMAFYIDGKLEGRHPKNFRTEFMPTDSVMAGNSANKKNQRYTNGIIDDIEFYDRVLNDKEVLELYHSPNPVANKIFYYGALLILLLLALIAGIYYFIKYRLSLGIKKEKQKLELYNMVLETELRVNRALMNPHFMFNSLNNLHNYILTNNVEKASDYLIKFSKLIRKILDSNTSNTISLEVEIQLLELYLEIEALRFKEQIRHTISIEPDVIPSSITIPIMMLQPFIENSIWHGFRYKPGEKNIHISFSLFKERYLLCVIEDNGTGRKTTIKKEKKSMATNFIIQRLALLNKIHGLSCWLEIIDKPNETGTVIKITLPMLNIRL